MTPPFFSVIIPTFNRPRALFQCLMSIACADFPQHEMEVIVVDDGGKAPLAPLISLMRHRLNVFLVRRRHSGPAAARNTGADSATGRFLVFTDDDCRFSSAWFRIIRKAADAGPDSLIGGTTLNGLPENRYSAASQLLVDYVYRRFNQQGARFFASNNMAMPASGFHAIGGFDPSFPTAAGEDRDCCNRWLSRGYPMIGAPSAVIYHYHPLTFASFFRQHYRYGQGAYRFHTSVLIRSPGLKILQPASFYRQMFGYPFLFMAKKQAAVRMGFLLAVSQCATAMGLLLSSIRRG